MKTRYLILLALVVLAFTSCELSSTTNHTPQIMFVQNPFVSKTDTLKSLLKDDGAFHLDTVSVGDTVTFRIFLNGFTNNLSTYNIIQSDTASTKLLLPFSSSLDSIFLLVASDYSIGKFIFRPKITNVYFPFRYVAKKVTNEAKLTFNLSSDANFNNSGGLGNNSTTIILKTPVKLPVKKL